MNTYKKNIGQTFLILFAIFIAACNSPVESGTKHNDDMLETLSTMPKEDIDSTEQKGLVFMREEEKLARDVYIVMYEKWGLTIFDNISRSEQKHMDAVKVLLDRYSIEDPIENDVHGVFKNQDIQALYDGLIESGTESLVDALYAGTAIEEIDILDLISNIEVIDNEDINFVYENLLRGSRNHLRAFVRNLNNQGIIYEARYMAQEAYEEIINSEMERGGKGKKGKGNGKGRRG